MFCFLLFHSHCLPLQVRSLWSLNQGISVTSALFSTWTRAPPRTHTAAAGDTTTTWRYAHTPARHLNTQEHTVGLTLFVFSLFCFQKHYKKLEQEPSRSSQGSISDWSRLSTYWFLWTVQSLETRWTAFCATVILGQYFSMKCLSGSRRTVTSHKCGRRQVTSLVKWKHLICTN